MALKQIKESIYSVGAIDWDRELFDELIPLPDGTSYNSYLIQGSEKTALIDTVDFTTVNQLMENLNELGTKKIDYIISNHAEQDHSGSIPYVLEKYPEAKVVTNEKCKNMLMDLLDIKEDLFIVIKDKEVLSLGNKTLEFHLMPWVHWPETMATYLVEDKVLFSCDFFGGHIATNDLYKENSEIYESAKRYFAEIMYPFRAPIKNNLKKVDALDIEIIAPSHGVLYNEPEFIINAYKEWVSDNVKNEVVLCYVSMHDSTKKMAEHLAAALTKQNIEVKMFNLTNADIGQLAISIVDAATLIVGTPNVLAGAHPTVVSTVYFVNAIRPKTKFAGIFTSYGWKDSAAEQIKVLLSNFKGELLEPVTIKGLAKHNDLSEIDRLANDIAEKHKELGILK